MITITTTPAPTDVQALRDFLGGQRRGLTLHVPDIITGEMIHVSVTDLDPYEAWIVNGDPGITTGSDRQRHLVDDATEEPVGPRDKLYYVTWRDTDGEGHKNRLSRHSLDSLRSQVSADEYGESEILEEETYAEPTRLLPVLWQLARQ